jgi:isoleucyl-tRNA synthetase
VFRATPQWYISMDKANLRTDALAAIDSVGWFPAWGKARIQSMVDGRPDWTISRQRTWGVPIALFTHRQTGEIHPRSVELMQQDPANVAQGARIILASHYLERIGDRATNIAEDIVFLDTGEVEDLN